MKINKLFTLPFFTGLALGALTITAVAATFGSSVFPDVQPGSYYDGAVGRLYNSGIIKGNPDGKYHPADFVTRADIAVMLDRALNGTTQVSTTPVIQRSSSSSSSSSSISYSSSSTSSSVTIGTAGAFRFSMDKTSLPESLPKLSLVVQRYNGTKGSAIVHYATSDGTAKSGTHYNEASGDVAFADGETSKTITLHFIDNKSADPNVWFNVNLSGATGGAVVGTPGTIMVTVLDNDGGGGNITTNSSVSSTSSAGSSYSSGSSAPGGSITFSAWAYAIDESAGAIPITVLRKGNSASSVAVNYATVAGTATSGVNYTDTQGTINFAAGETTKTFSVQVNHQGSIDGNKSLTLKLSNVTGGASLDAPNNVPLTVVDSENNASGTGTVMFSADNYDVQRSAGTALVTVYRRGGYAGTVTVQYATGDNTAVSGSDYTAQSGTLTFAPGESNKSFSIPIIAPVFSGSKRINLTLGTITGNALMGAQPTSSVTIFGQ